MPAGFEGGQMPLHMRVPKLKGFNNPFRVEYQGINLDVIEASGRRDEPGDPPRPGPRPQGRPREGARPGRATRAVTVPAHAFSEAAEAAITAAGGTVEVLPCPRATAAPVKGNQFANR